MRLCKATGFATALLAAGAGCGVKAAPLAEALFDMESGEVCFPMELTTTGRFYDVCLAQAEAGNPLAFTLASVVPGGHELAGIPTYSQSEGLDIPLVRLSDGRVFTDVHLDVALDTATSTYAFAVARARRIDRDHDLEHHSVARLWNEVMLNSIRSDLARPTVHARNLFHSSIAMYDAWAAFDETADPYILGRTLNGSSCAYDGKPGLIDAEDHRDDAISYAAFRVLRHRFAGSPGEAAAYRLQTDLMKMLGLDPDFESTDYSAGSGAALGNYIGACVIAFGLADGANEADRYAPRHYQTVNPALSLAQSGNGDMLDPDRWQPLAFEEFIDQSGNVFLGNTPPFVTPEWGHVYPFALSQADLTVKERDGVQWPVYHDPGGPALLRDETTADDFKWSHQLVSIWASHHDPFDGVLIDISPGSIGNIQDYPATLAGHRDFYDLFGGGDTSVGHELNPATGEPYEPQIVPRGDYTRVLAQFWADGPRSETPPGHWFTIFNKVADHPLMEKRYRGQGPVLDDLEWDVKGYFAMGGAVHDVSVSVWSIKGWYDSSRPVSALRYMGGKGQSSDPTAANYDPEGLDLVPGYIESVLPGDPLAGANGENVGRIKLFTWRGPTQVEDPATELSGVGWILADDWWPYQTRTFVTPPFAGYISGHSTYSRAAADLMTLFTGDPFFPGGLGEFMAPKDTWLDTEKGPSVDVVLQWATYRDASDQTSLSRIWGGIHPPMDDMVGRRIGSEIGNAAFAEAEAYFLGNAH